MTDYIVYLRVSTSKQSVDGQKFEILKKFNPIKKIFEENVSGKNIEDRPVLKEALDYLREGDTLVVHSYSRLSRSLSDLLKIINLLKEKKVTLISLTENFDSNSPQGRLFITVLASLAQFEREILLERQRAGIEAAKLKGKYKGRQPLS
jgi:DNA invertase Pin-like site-specific DNA recombinase